MGLTALGERAIRGIIDKRMIFDPDHMSVLARNQALDIVESARVPGRASTSHSWSTDNALPRISALGGLIGPMAGTSQGFVDQWNHISDARLRRRRTRTGSGSASGADMNGFASQGGPRTPDGREPGGHLSVPVLRRHGDDPQQQSRASARSTSTSTASPTTASTRTGSRTCASSAARQIVDDLAAGRRGVPADVGARRPGSARGGPRGAARPEATAPSPARSGKCAKLRAKLKRAKSKQAKRKLRGKLRKRGC